MEPGLAEGVREPPFDMSRLYLRSAWLGPEGAVMRPFHPAFDACQSDQPRIFSTFGASNLLAVLLRSVWLKRLTRCCGQPEML